MHLLAVLLLLLSLLSLHAGGTPSQASPPVAEISPEKPDPELESVRRLLEAGGLTVSHVGRMESGSIGASVRLGLCANPRIRDQETVAFVQRSRTAGLWLVRLTMGGRERARLNVEPTEAREELAKVLHLSPFLRDVMAASQDEDEEEPRSYLLHAAHHVSAADPRAFAAFVADVADQLSRVFAVEAEGLPLLVTPSERAREPLVAAQKNLADRLRVRAIQGLSSPRAGLPAAEDPLSMASHPINPGILRDLAGSDHAAEMLPELESSALSALPGHLALRRYLALPKAQPEEDAAAGLRRLAYEEDGVKARNAWALYLWGLHLIVDEPEGERAALFVEGLDALRESIRLGCEGALGCYLYALSLPDEPLVNGESHWENRARWEALFRHFDPHVVEEAVEVEKAYLAGDLSPVRIGVRAEGEELRQVRLAVEEMNAARKARGWKLIEVVEERPASEPLVGDAPTKDPAEAGSAGEG